MGRQNMLRKYFTQDLGEFYRHTANRLMLYPFVFSLFLIECAAFWLLYYGPSFWMEYMAFTTVYTLHKAAAYTIGIVGADLAVRYLAPGWGAYHYRTVGRLWAIWSLGLATGFVIQRTMVRGLVTIYAPDAAFYFMANPQARLGMATLLMILIPYWVIVLVLTVRIVRARQRVSAQADALAVPPECRPSGADAPGIMPAGMPTGSLRLGGDGENPHIALANITHVSMEDHYCRINYSTGNGLESELIRLPLKQMLMKLPRDHFLHIHRSHVVNMAYISRLTKNGRDRKVVIEPFDVELPISRSRFKDLKPRLGIAGAGSRP